MPAGCPPISCTSSFSERGQVFGQTIERTIPATMMRIAGAHRVETGLMQRQSGFAFLIFELYGQQRLGPGGIAVRICPVPGHDQSLGLDDFAKDALRPMIVTFGAAHMNSIGAART